MNEEAIYKRVVSAKNYLKKKSIDYNKNFKNIERFIKKEVEEIKNLKNSSKKIIPEIDFNEFDNNKSRIINVIKKRGCVIIRNVFEDQTILNLNKDLENYIIQNNYYEHQKKG